MRITANELRKIIKEEVTKVMAEAEQLQLPFDMPDMPPAAEAPEETDLDKLLQKFEAGLVNLKARIGPTMRKIDTPQELEPVLNAFLDIISELTKGGLTNQEIVRALTNLRNSRIQSQQS